MLSIIVILLLTGFLVLNFQRGVLLIFILRPFLSLCDDVGKMPVLGALNLLMIMMYVVTNRNFLSNIKGYPFLIGSILVAISIFLCNAFADEQHTPNTILQVIDVIILFILYEVTRTIDDDKAKWAVKVVLIFAIIVIANGLIETFTEKNILLDVLMNSGLYDSETKTIMGERYGFKRAQSIFGMHTSLAGYAIPPLAFLLYLMRKTRLRMPAITLPVIIGLGVMVLFSGARSGIIGMAIALLCVFDKSLAKGKYIFLALIIIIFVSPFVADYFEQIIASIQDTQKVGGSNTDMRQTQLDISLYYMARSPWVGNGIAYTWRVSTQFSEDLFGAESMWFPVMIDRGIVGILTLAVLCCNILFYVWWRDVRKFIFLVIGFFVFNTMSSIPDVTWTYMATFIFLLQRLYALHGENAPISNDIAE